MFLIIDIVIFKLIRLDSVYVFVLGWLIVCLVKVFIFIMFNLCCLVWYIILFIVCVLILFVIKLGILLMIIIFLFNIFCVKFFIFNMIDFFVCDVGINFINFIICGGLKKCRLKNCFWSFLLNVWVIVFIGIFDVFVVNKVFFLVCCRICC